MAKSKSILSLQGTLQGITHVDSRTYGEHVRAARGTHKPVDVNETFKIVGKQLITANGPAKLIKDALEPYRQDFYGGQMWQRLVSIFKRQFKLKGHFDFLELNDFEIYKEYPLRRFTTVSVNTKTDKNSRSLTVTVSYSPPVFKKVEYLTGYRFKVIGIFPVNNVGLTEVATSEIISRTSLSSNDIAFTLPIPPEASTVLLCIKFEGCKDGKVSAGHTTKGMAIVKVGIIEA